MPTETADTYTLTINGADAYATTANATAINAVEGDWIFNGFTTTNTATIAADRIYTRGYAEIPEITLTDGITGAIEELRVEDSSILARVRALEEELRKIRERLGEVLKNKSLKISEDELTDILGIDT